MLECIVNGASNLTDDVVIGEWIIAAILLHEFYILSSKFSLA